MVNVEEKKSEKNKFIQAIMDAQKKVKDLENDMALLLDSMRNFKKKVVFNQNMLEKMDQEIYLKQKEQKHLQRAYFSFYYYLLETGLDFRQTGIAWIVAKLHNYRQKLDHKHLPTYLDQKAKDFLLKKAHYLQAMDQLYASQSTSFKNYQRSAQLDRSMSLLENSNLLDTSMPSLLLNDHSKFTAIDIDQIKLNESLKKNKQISPQEIHDLTNGMKSEHAKAIENIVADINYKNQMTAGYLIYQESQHKLHEYVKKLSEP